MLHSSNRTTKGRSHSTRRRLSMNENSSDSRRVDDDAPDFRSVLSSPSCSSQQNQQQELLAERQAEVILLSRVIASLVDCWRRVVDHAADHAQAELLHMEGNNGHHRVEGSSSETEAGKSYADGRNGGREASYRQGRALYFHEPPSSIAASTHYLTRRGSSGGSGHDGARTLTKGKGRAARTRSAVERWRTELRPSVQWIREMQTRVPLDAPLRSPSGVRSRAHGCRGQHSHGRSVEDGTEEDSPCVKNRGRGFCHDGDEGIGTWSHPLVDTLPGRTIEDVVSSASVVLKGIKALDVSGALARHLVQQEVVALPLQQQQRASRDMYDGPQQCSRSGDIDKHHERSVYGHKKESKTEMRHQQEAASPASPSPKQVFSSARYFATAVRGASAVAPPHRNTSIPASVNPILAGMIAAAAGARSTIYNTGSQKPSLRTDGGSMPTGNHRHFTPLHEQRNRRSSSSRNPLVEGHEACDLRVRDEEKYARENILERTTTSPHGQRPVSLSCVVSPMTESLLPRSVSLAVDVSDPSAAAATAWETACEVPSTLPLGSHCGGRTRPPPHLWRMENEMQHDDDDGNTEDIAGDAYSDFYEYHHHDNYYDEEEEGDRDEEARPPDGARQRRHPRMEVAMYATEDLLALSQEEAKERSRIAKTHSEELVAVFSGLMKVVMSSVTRRTQGQQQGHDHQKQQQQQQENMPIQANSALPLLSENSAASNICIANEEAHHHDNKRPGNLELLGNRASAPATATAAAERNSFRRTDAAIPAAFSATLPDVKPPPPPDPQDPQLLSAECESEGSTSAAAVAAEDDSVATATPHCIDSSSVTALCSEDRHTSSSIAHPTQAAAAAAVGVGEVESTAAEQSVFLHNDASEELNVVKPSLVTRVSGRRASRLPPRRLPERVRRQHMEPQTMYVEESLSISEGSHAAAAAVVLMSPTLLPERGAAPEACHPLSRSTNGTGNGLAAGNANAKKALVSEQDVETDSDGVPSPPLVHLLPHKEECRSSSSKNSSGGHDDEAHPPRCSPQRRPVRSGVLLSPAPPPPSAPDNDAEVDSNHTKQQHQQQQAQEQQRRLLLSSRKLLFQSPSPAGGAVLNEPRDRSGSSSSRPLLPPPPSPPSSCGGKHHNSRSNSTAGVVYDCGDVYHEKNWETRQMAPVEGIDGCRCCCSPTTPITPLRLIGLDMDENAVSPSPRAPPPSAAELHIMSVLNRKKNSSERAK